MRRLSRRERSWLATHLGQAEALIAELPNGSAMGFTPEALDEATGAWIDSGMNDEMRVSLVLAYGQYLVELSNGMLEWATRQRDGEQEFVLRGPLKVNVYFWRAANDRLRGVTPVTFETLAAIHQPVAVLAGAMPKTRPWWRFWA